MSGRRTRLADILPQRLADDQLLSHLVDVLDAMFDSVADQVDDIGPLFDPALAPDPVVNWLCWWLGWDLPAGWPAPEVRRRLLHASGDLLRTRATAAGIRELVRVIGGDDVSDVEVIDPGYVRVGSVPSPGGLGSGNVEVRIRGRLVTEWPTEDLERLRRLIWRDAPAGVPLLVSFAPGDT